LPTLEHEVEVALGGVDDNRARLLAGRVGHLGAEEARIELGQVDGRYRETLIRHRAVHGAVVIRDRRLRDGLEARGCAAGERQRGEARAAGEESAAAGDEA